MKTFLSLLVAAMAIGSFASQAQAYNTSCHPYAYAYEVVGKKYLVLDGKHYGPVADKTEFLTLAASDYPREQIQYVLDYVPLYKNIVYVNETAKKYVSEMYKGCNRYDLDVIAQVKLKERTEQFIDFMNRKYLWAPHGSMTEHRHRMEQVRAQLLFKANNASTSYRKEAYKYVYDLVGERYAETR